MDLLEPMEQAGELDSYLFLLLFYSNWLICSREYLLIICITPKTTHTHPSFSQNNPPPHLAFSAPPALWEAFPTFK